jgi:hypothetical protein
LDVDLVSPVTLMVVPSYILRSVRVIIAAFILYKFLVIS